MYKLSKKNWKLKMEKVQNIIKQLKHLIFQIFMIFLLKKSIKKAEFLFISI